MSFWKQGWVSLVEKVVKSEGGTELEEKVTFKRWLLSCYKASSIGPMDAWEGD